MKICLEVSAENIDGEHLYSVLQNLNPAHCDELSKLAVDDLVYMGDGVSVYRTK